MGGSNAKKSKGRGHNSCVQCICTEYSYVLRLHSTYRRILSTIEKRGVAFFAGVDQHRMAQNETPTTAPPRLGSPSGDGQVGTDMGMKKERKKSSTKLSQARRPSAEWRGGSRPGSPAAIGPRQSDLLVITDSDQLRSPSHCTTVF